VSSRFLKTGCGVGVCLPSTSGEPAASATSAGGHGAAKADTAVTKALATTMRALLSAREQARVDELFKLISGI
jgi:hypothetical protein